MRKPARYWVEQCVANGSAKPCHIWQVLDGENNNEPVLLDAATEHYATFGSRREARELAARLNARMAH